jgi:hypothetical protein
MRIVPCPFAFAKCTECDFCINYSESDRSILTALHDHEKDFHNGTGATETIQTQLHECRVDLDAAMKGRRREWAAKFAHAARTMNERRIRQLLMLNIDEEATYCKKCRKCGELNHWEKQRCCSRTFTIVKVLYPTHWTYDPHRVNPLPMPVDVFEKSDPPVVQEKIQKCFHARMKELVRAELDRIDSDVKKRSEQLYGQVKEIAMGGEKWVGMSFDKELGKDVVLTVTYVCPELAHDMYYAPRESSH